MFARLKKAIAAFTAGMFVVSYIFLFLPALVYIPFMGVFGFDMSIWAGILCILGLLTIPLSMPVSIYFVFSTYSQRSYLNKIHNTQHCINEIAINHGSHA